MSELLKQVVAAGYVNLRAASDEELNNFIIPACLTAFSDGEIDIKHPKVDGYLAHQYGAELCSKGAFTIGLACRASQGGLQGLQRLMGEYLAVSSLIMPERYALPRSAIGLGLGHVVLDEVCVPVEDTIRGVVEFGPGLAGYRHIEEQSTLATRGNRPFSYTAVSKGAFVSAFLQAIAQIGGHQARPTNGEVICYSDGIGGSISHIPGESADVIICSGLQSVSPDELGVGFAGAKRILRKGGMLVLRAVADAYDTETDARRMLAMARTSGFSAPILQHETSVTYDVVSNGAVQKHSRRVVNAVLIN